MKMLHKKSGFTLVEVVLAMAIVGVVMTSVFVAQAGALYAINRVSNVLRRIYAAQNYMMQKRVELVNSTEPKSDQKMLTSPAATLSYKLEKSNNAGLKPFKDVYLEQVILSWKEQRTPCTDALVSFVFKPPRPENE